MKFLKQAYAQLLYRKVFDSITFFLSDYSIYSKSANLNVVSLFTRKVPTLNIFTILLKVRQNSMLHTKMEKCL